MGPMVKFRRYDIGPLLSSAYWQTKLNQPSDCPVSAIFGVRVTVGKDKARLTFEKLARVQETRRAFYLFLSDTQAWILPKSQIEENFYRRFFAQQFKRSCMPDGPKVGSVSLSPRGDWRMPLGPLADFALYRRQQLR